MGNQRVGAFGDVSTFSFQYNKLLTAGEGGLVATNDKKTFEKMNDFQDLEWEENLILLILWALFIKI